MRLLERHLHNLLCAGITRTDPVPVRPAPISICSLVCSRDFTMYLVAIKSFYSRFGMGKVVAINDGSLTERQIAVLKEQVPGIILQDMKDVPRRQVPRGGCWERLLAVIDLAQTDYVIQLDSDTLTRRPLAEVMDACLQKRPFIMAGDREGAQILSRQAAAAQAPAGNHIQTQMEQRLADIPGLQPNYVRGCAAFFGIPPGQISFAAVEEFSQIMQRAFGARWQEWGTEQATVNYLLANLANTLVLQPPKYTHRWQRPPEDDSAFIHFIGTHRFDRQFYASQSRRVIRELRRPLFRPGVLDPASFQPAEAGKPAGLVLPEISRQ